MELHLSNLYDKDIYLSLAGGFKSLEAANDLAIAFQGLERKSFELSFMKSSNVAWNFEFEKECGALRCFSTLGFDTG